MRAGVVAILMAVRPALPSVTIVVSFGVVGVEIVRLVPSNLKKRAVDRCRKVSYIVLCDDSVPSDAEGS
jgi:hypothetical protein